MTDKIWKLRNTEPFDNQPALTGGEGLSGDSYPLVVRKFLHSRKILKSSQLQELTQAKLSQLADPFTLQGVPEAVDRIEKAYLNKEKIALYGDFDLDGTSGVALMSAGLEDLGFKDFKLYQPKRLTEGYGFHTEAVKKLASESVSLIITIDVGITSFAAHEEALRLGVDVILTDHHKPLDELPKAFTIVNPNLRTCTAGLGYLCGTGVSYYLLRALFTRWVQKSYIAKEKLDLKKYLDCFCIATLTDMVPLVHDNRILVKHGLLQLAETKRPGLKALLRALKLDSQPLSGADVAIRFAPKLNALSRMERDVMPIDIYVEKNPSVAEDLVKKVLKNNLDRQAEQKTGETWAFEQMSSWDEKSFIFLYSEILHKGVIGLVATKLCQAYNCPVFIATVKDGVLVGSARSPQGAGISLVTAMSTASEILKRFGGHDQAAGFELTIDQAPNFKAALKEYFTNLSAQRQPVVPVANLLIEADPSEQMPDDPSTRNFYSFDGELDLNEINESSMKWLETLGPYGTDFETPVFCFEHIVIKSVTELKGGHYKFKIESAADGSAAKGHHPVVSEALFFSPPFKIEDKWNLKDISLMRFNIYGELQWNYFAGQRKPQILVRDLIPADEV